MQGFSWSGCNGASNHMTSSPCLRSETEWQKFACATNRGAYRVIYLARLADAVYVLHAFQKKTQAMPQRDIELARKRYADLRREVL